MTCFRRRLEPLFEEDTESGESDDENSALNGVGHQVGLPRSTDNWILCVCVVITFIKCAWLLFGSVICLLESFKHKRLDVF